MTVQRVLAVDDEEYNLEIIFFSLIGNIYTHYISYGSKQSEKFI